MALNLKEINYLDSDQIKLDKVNYNFDQLVANGGGPRGHQGADGLQGFQGAQGPQGLVGAQGTQGDQGPIGDSGGEYWSLIEGDVNNTIDTLIPKHEVGQLPPIVMMGFASNDPAYIQGLGPNVDSQVIINRPVGSIVSNFKLSSSAVDTEAHFKLEDGGDLQIYFLDLDQSVLTNNVKFNADSYTFADNNGDLLTVSNLNVTVNPPATFNSDVTVQGKLKIETGNPDTDKIAVAKDSTGEIEFKSFNEIGSTVPVGTIISILPSIFIDDTKFNNTDTVSVGVNDNLEITVGAGLGDYEGWYICNGQEWKDGTGTSFQVPDLSSFSYDIEDNTDSTTGQGGASQTNDDLHLIGGADIDMDANYASGNYTITSTIDTTTDYLLQGTTGGTNLTIKRLPQIIYLGVAGLYWEQGGSQAPVTNTYIFDNSVPSVPNQQFSFSLPQGQQGQVLIQLFAGNNLMWAQIPDPTTDFADLNGSTLPNISFGPPISINANDPQLLDIYMGQVSNGGTYTFNYNAPGFYSNNILVDNQSTYDLDCDNNVTVSFGSNTSLDNNGHLIAVGNNGQSSDLTDISDSNDYIKFEAPAGRTFATNGITPPAGYTFTPINSGTTIITGNLSVDSFIRATGIGVSFSAALNLVLPTPPTPSITINSYTGQWVNFNLSWTHATGFNSSTMDYRVEYALQDGDDPATLPGSWIYAGITDSNSFGPISTSYGTYNSIRVWARIIIIETGTANQVAGQENSAFRIAVP